MSDEVSTFKYSLFLNGGETNYWWYEVDDAFWGISVVTQGTNNKVEITRLFSESGADGRVSLGFAVKNDTPNPTVFTVAFIRSPGY